MERTFSSRLHAYVYFIFMNKLNFLLIYAKKEAFATSKSQIKVQKLQIVVNNFILTFPTILQQKFEFVLFPTAVF